MGDDQPFFQLDIYALQEERLIAKQPLLMTIEEIASHFIKQIIAVQPSGPYFLAGQCDGGIVALEIARQFEKQGRKVASLMEFDTPVTGYFQPLPWHRILLELFSDVRHGKVTVRRCFRSVARRTCRVFSPKKEAARDEHTPTVEHIRNVIWNAVRMYENKMSIDAEITLFRATERNRGIKDVAIGWDRIGTVQVFDVPGGHLSLFRNRDAQSIIRRVLQGSHQRASESTPQCLVPGITGAPSVRDHEIWLI